MIQTYRSPKTKIKVSQKGGKGLFADENISEGEVVAIRSGHIVNVEEARILDSKLGDFSLQISDGFFLCPRRKEEVEDLAIYINHSCDPNIGMDGQISFVAMRNIGKGEELCLDYAMAISGEYKLNCSCGSSQCRKEITGNDWKIEDLQKRYNKYFSWFICKKIQNPG